MDYLYKFPLFDRNDAIRAYNYLVNEEDSPQLRPEDLSSFYQYTETKETTNFLIVRANMKLVQDITYLKLLPYLSGMLNILGQKHHVVVLNPGIITAAYNPFMQNTISKILPYLVYELYDLPNLWICFDKITIDNLEQIIKLYPDEVTYSQGKTYVKILPNDSFAFIYDFIHHVFGYC